MSKCPQCDAEVAAGQRFCPQCGARQPEAPADPAAQPAPEPAPQSPGGTIILPPTPLPPTQALNPPAPPPEPAPGGLFGLPPSGGAASPPPASAAPVPPPAAPAAYTPPPAAYAPPPAAYAPPPAAPPAQPAKGKSRWGLILGIIVGLVALACIAVVAGGWFLFRSFGDVVTSLTPMPGLDGTAVVADPGRVIASDTFDTPSDSLFSDGETEDATFSFAEGGYTITLNRDNYLIWVGADGTYGDGSIEVDATVEEVSSAAAALIFHYQDQDNFYMFLVYGDGSYGLRRYIGNEPVDLVEATSSPAINGLGQTNRLRVETEGSTIRLYANGELLTEVDDASFSSGEIAIGVSTQDEPGVTTRYDNLTIRGTP